MPGTNGADIVSLYAERGMRFVFWPQNGDDKGPKIPDWPKKTYTPKDYQPGLRVGLLTGYELAPGQWLHDIDIDWAPGAKIALQFLPPTDFIFGRTSKKWSHCFYLLPECLPTFKYEDIDKSSLIELRGSKLDGHVGFQTMAPPSKWSKGELHEDLLFVKDGIPSPTSVTLLRNCVRLSATGMIFAKHFGHNGFGHDVRLAWAGYLLRLGVAPDELIRMGEAISEYCNNIEVADVRRVVESTVAALKQDGKKVKGAPSLMRLLGNKNGPLIIQQINRWFDQDGDFVRTDKGVIVKDHQENIIRALSLLNVELSYDEFSERMLIDRHLRLDDYNMNELWFRIDSAFKFRPTDTFFAKMVAKIAMDNPFHPARDYFAELVWDGTPRLDTWLIDYAGAPDTTYVRFVSSIPLIAAVRRIRQPGCKYDEMLVLEGTQGMNKSSALRALCPVPDWFSDDLPLNVDSKRIIESTLGKMIIESSDLAGKRKTEVELLKAMLSRQVDGPVRMAYGRLSTERPRQFVIIGTTNSDAYLMDITGARRMWPVKIQGFNVEGIIRDRDQLWAEAATREANGESIRLPEEMWPVAAQEQEHRREEDPWEDDLRAAVSAIIPDTEGKRRVAVSTLFEWLKLPVERRDRAGSRRIAEIMQRLGFRKTTVRISGAAPAAGYITDRTDALERTEEPEEITDVPIRKEDAPF